jgi:hypothetical protein
MAPRLAPERTENPAEFHTHQVRAVMADDELPPNARLVFARVPAWFWTSLLEELEEFRARGAHSTITIELAMSYGIAKDVVGTVVRKVRKQCSERGERS